MIAHRVPWGVFRLALALGLAMGGNIPLPAGGAIVVTTTTDSGPGSLRQAILDANAAPEPATIAFAIDSPGSVQTLQPLSALPSITNAVFIDGWSQGGSGYTGPPLIALNGALAGSHIIGLNITAGNSTVRGLAINDFAVGSLAGGIRLQTGGHNWIYGNHIGLNPAGDTRIPNQRGIWIENGSSHNRIGTDADGVNDVAERNVISGNVEQNIWIYRSTTISNRIMGNYIGLNASGTAALGTTMATIATSGIMVQESHHTVIGTDGDGQGDALEGNVISGNIYNIYLTATGTNISTHTRIAGNRIGTTADGTQDVGLQVEGVRVYSTAFNLIGTDGDGVSDALEGNLISGNNDFGIMLQQTGAISNIVAGNKIGTDITGMVAIPNGTSGSPRAGILLGGYGNRIGTNRDGVSDDLERNLISGHANVAVYGIYFNNLPEPGAPATIIDGNWIGVDATGLGPLTNNYGIGGHSYVPVIIRDNVIAASTYDGIASDSSGLRILGNRIGVGADGVTPLGNGYNGIFLSGNDNILGGTGPGEGNIIAHNGRIGPYYSGVRVGNTGLRNTIRGNRIHANSQLGIDLRWADGVTLNDPGDADTGANNLQNFPVITLAQGYASGTTHLTGTLNSYSNTLFTLDFYYNALPDISGYGEGEYYLGEAVVMTGADGNAAFDVVLPVTLPPNVYVTATATHADGSTSEFSAAYAAGGVLDEPIEGLTASHSGLGYVSNAVTFTAAVTAGTGVSFLWNFGDGHQAAGALVSHEFTSPGIWPVTVTATNNGSGASRQLLVSIIVPANLNGLVWNDLDADGIPGIGETGFTSAVVTVSGPGFLVATNVDAQGRYAVFTGEAGLYEIHVTASNHIATTAHPVAVPMSEEGGTVVNVGLHASPSNGYAFITGRAWIDLDGSGFPELDEEPLAGLEGQIYGYQYPLHPFTTDSNGLFSLHLPSLRSYFLSIAAPGYFPAKREWWVWLDDEQQFLTLHAPFGRGGNVSGRVLNTSGQGVPGTFVNIGMPIAVTVTDANGDYAFTNQAPSETKGLGLNLPPPYVNLGGGSAFRVFNLPTNGVVFQNWTVERIGRLTVRARQALGGQYLPAGSSFFRLQGGNVDEWLVTGLDGLAGRDLDPGVYTVTPVAETIPEGTLVSPASRSAYITNSTFATVDFYVAPAQSIAVHCLASGVAFPATVDVHTNGGLATAVTLNGQAGVTTFTDLAPGTYDVRILPAPGLAGWPIHNQVVALNSGTHATVTYPYNPANLQSLYGYAFWDRCAPLGVRGDGYGCTETSVAANNGLKVTLFQAAGGVVTNTETRLGTGWATGFYRFDDLPVGDYRVGISLPPGATPTTSTNVLRSLDGIATPEQVHFGYQLSAAQALTGRVFIDADGNGGYDPAWDDAVSGALIEVRTPTETLVASMNAASDGTYTLGGLAAGEYRVRLSHAGAQQTQTVQLPASGASVTVDFPLAPPGTNLRALVFDDVNANGLADPGEQRFGGVSVELAAGLCDDFGLVLETVTTDMDGMAVFASPPGDGPLCARITHGLPPNTVPSALTGAAMSRGSGLPAPLAVVPSLLEPPLEVLRSRTDADDAFTLYFRSTLDRTYAVEETGDLQTWPETTVPLIAGTGYVTRIQLQVADDPTNAYFRVLER